MPRQHPCIRHIDRCAAVIAAGGDTAERIRREVEQAEAERLREAVSSQALGGETLAGLIERTAGESDQTTLRAALLAHLPASRRFLSGVAGRVPTFHEQEEVEHVAP